MYMYVCACVCVFMYASTCMSLNGCVCTHRCTHKYISLSLSLSHLQRTYFRVCASILYAELSHLIANQTLNTSEFVSQPCQLVLCGTADV